MSNLSRILECRRDEAPNRIGLYDEDGRSWSYGEMDALAARVARVLQSRGVGVGQRVAFFVTNGPDLVFLMFGAWKLGAISVTISSLYNQAELIESIAKTEPRLLVADDAKPDAVRGAAKTGIEVCSTAGAFEAAEEFHSGAARACDGPDRDPQSEACILFTGGTSGQSKAVSVMHGGVINALERLARVSTGQGGWHALKPEQTPPNLIALPLFHSGGQHSLLFAMYVGRACVVWKRFGVERLRTLMGRHRFDNFFFLPTMLFDIVHSETNLPFEGVKSVLVAGQALSIPVRRRFEERYRVPILMNYGSTEAGHIAGWNGTDMRAGRWKPGSVGRVYEGVELEVRSEDDTALATGEAGEIVVRSTMTKGYADDAEASAELVRNGWLYTGDIGYVDEDGVLFLVGRKRDMIKCGGFQVWPEEIEDQLRDHPRVHDVRIVGVAEERLGEIPAALVVRDDGYDGTDEAFGAELIEFARARLAHFKAPRTVVLVSALERSEAGKLQRGALDPETLEVLR